MSAEFQSWETCQYVSMQATAFGASWPSQQPMTLQLPSVCWWAAHADITNGIPHH